tara:strand:- start:116670 stop:117299 length:630 start_codon:yes stop_codon:yes gene_type:complete
MALCLALASLTVMAATSAMAQDEGEYTSGEDDYGDNPNDDGAPGASRNPYDIAKTPRATPEATSSVTTAISGSYAFCVRAVAAEYLVDCLGEQLKVITQSMSNTGDYGEARKILEDTSNKLRKLAAANAAPNLPRVRVKSKINNKAVATKPLTPVRKEAVKQVNAQAADILAEAETKLLRSAGSSDRRLIAYAQMAKAVGSNKTLLRSA